MRQDFLRGSAYLWCSTGFINTHQQRNKTSSILDILESCYLTCMTYTSAECTVEKSWWWAEELPETFRVSW